MRVGSMIELARFATLQWSALLNLNPWHRMAWEAAGLMLAAPTCFNVMPTRYRRG
jgi:hypothetical protein